MTTTRDSFNSRIGFILSAAGSAIGLGNIWGFPSQAANNGGGAFLLAYLVVTLLLALPALYAEIYIGNQTQRNPVAALRHACQDAAPKLGHYAGLIGLLGAVLMLSFYTIVAGWMLAHALAPLAQMGGFEQGALWLSTSGTARNVVFTPLFIVLGAAIIHQGIRGGVEKWSARLMPVLFIMLIALILYISQQPGAAQGFAVYLIPDFSQLKNPQLIVSAMGQAFFSLSIGVGGMMVYGSYMKKTEDLGKLVLSITALDTLIAFLAGLLIIPALFVAQHAGQEVFIDGQIADKSQLIFTILPTLFNSMGDAGLVVTLGFFSLLSIAALTSTLAATEVPVSYLVEDKAMPRSKATWLVACAVLVCSMVIVAFYELLFGAIIGWLTTIQLPLMGLFYFIVAGWLWSRGNKLTDQAMLNQSIKLKLWGNYLRYVCPVLILAVFINISFIAH